jgi:hypothetical protein
VAVAEITPKVGVCTEPPGRPKIGWFGKIEHFQPEFQVVAFP